ncbi:MAG: MBL fold metallo-hydrolase, partial [Clostridiales bacterium]|nr:MBL fold metallo-hydrolase [Clostridiales bacterium]
MLQLKENLFYVGVQDAALRVFDIIMNTPYGTSYNAYVLKGSQKTALIDASKDGFEKEFLRRVQEVTPLDKIDYLIVSHTEPDHAGIIPLLVEKNPNLELVGTNSAITFVTNIIKQSFKSRAVKKGDTLDLGDRQLQFYPMPNLHWPDTLFTYDPVSGALFTCDFFGAHFSWDGVLLSKMEDKSAYHAAQYQYFLDIMAPFR